MLLRLEQYAPSNDKIGNNIIISNMLPSRNIIGNIKLPGNNINGNIASNNIKLGHKLLLSFVLCIVNCNVCGLECVH